MSLGKWENASFKILTGSKLLEEPDTHGTVSQILPGIFQFLESRALETCFYNLFWDLATSTNKT